MNIFFSDYQQNYQLLHDRRGRGRLLPATPNKPSDVQHLGLNSGPRVSLNHFRHKLMS